MINGILDNDLYKFTMQQAVFMLYSEVEVEYSFINRGKTKFPEGFANQLQIEIEKMSEFKLGGWERLFLEEKCQYLTLDYLDYLVKYRFNPGQVVIKQTGSELEILIKGLWQETILWEVPLMAMISELYFKMCGFKKLSRINQIRYNKRKAYRLAEAGVQFADFGTRRRFSSEIHFQLLSDILSVKENTLIGTSNVHFTRVFGIKPIGTMAHEWIMFHAIQHGYIYANIASLATWKTIYEKDLGVALTDTFTTDEFLLNLNPKPANDFDGVRQDSGDPKIFVDKIINHYENLGIDPKTKTIVFSDGLDVEKAIELHEYCKGRIKDSYGIGTNLTNDVGVIPLNMVIKLSRCKIATGEQWHNVIKLSDSPGKHTGDKREIKRCLEILRRNK